MINGITYDLQNVTSADMAHMYWTMLGLRDGISSGCSVSISGNTIYITPGYFEARGHLTKLTGETSVTVPTVASGVLYCSLVYEIDLSQSASESEFTQGSFKIISSASGYPALTKEDLDNGGTTYQMEFARFTNSPSGVANFAPNAELFDTWAQADVPAAGWSNTYPYTQTISMPTSTADKYPVYALVMPENVTQEQAVNILDAYNCLNELETTNGGIVLTCYTDKPSVDFTIRLRGI